MSAPNPKTLVGQLKVPTMSVLPPASIIYEAAALRHGAYFAPRRDREEPGYGPYNWRDQPIEAMIYVDATMRHLMSYVDGQDLDPDSLVHHLGHAKAALGILIDAIENRTVIDDRPKVRSQAASRLLAELRRSPPSEPPPDVRVRCRCGWEGVQSELVKCDDQSLECPVCDETFLAPVLRHVVMITPQDPYLTNPQREALKTRVNAAVPLPESGQDPVQASPSDQSGQCAGDHCDGRCGAEAGEMCMWVKPSSVSGLGASATTE